MPGMSHRWPHINLTISSTPHKKINFRGEKQKTITKEVGRLLTTDFIREVMYVVWLENMVMMRKPTGK